MIRRVVVKGMNIEDSIKAAYGLSSSNSEFVFDGTSNSPMYSWHLE